MRAVKKSTLVLKVNPSRPDERIISYAAAGIRYGRLVAFPTETVYGIAANLFCGDAVSELSRVKKRPRGKPYTVHIADIATIRKMGCRLDRRARALAGKYWPGPLTLILKSKRGTKTGFRMPANKVALELIRRAEVPVVAPSANVSGNRPPVNVSEVLRELDGKLDMVIDAGKTKVGVESTIVDLAVDPPKILREGAIPSKDIFRLIARNRIRQNEVQ